MSDDFAHTSIWRWQNLRWAACFALALTFHGAGAAVLVARWSDENSLMPNAPTITIDLAPIAVSPTTTPSDAPPDQVESKLREEIREPEPDKPPEKVEIPPDNTPQPELAVIPPPKPVEKPKEKKPKQLASLARTPTAADQKADHAAAPNPGANGNPNAVPNWISQVFAQIARNKRAVNDTPVGAVASVSFTVDRSGGVHNVRLARSSGSSALDQEAQAMVARAAPLPPPPAEKPGTQIALTVPVRHTGR